MSKLSATAKEWKPPQASPAAGGGFKLPNSAANTGPPSDAPYESSDGFPTPPLGFKPNDANGEPLSTDDEEDNNQHGGYYGGGYGGYGAGYSGTFEGGDPNMTWEEQMQQVQQDADLVPPQMGVDDNGEVDWQKWYDEMREMQKKQIEDQLADEEAYRRELQERRQREAEEKREKAPVTINGNKRWPKKKLTNHQRIQQEAKRSGFDSFSEALKNGTSPFMPPLRQRCGTSLPHIKVDQRFGKRGEPHTAVSQFIVAPVVANYRPKHFHDVTPGDLMEYHYDFSMVLKAIPSSSCIAIAYGKKWKPFEIPYCFLSCKDYKGEVLSLCPNEAPNSKADALYEDDITKDVTELILAVPELDVLKKQSIRTAMAKRANLTPMYHVFNRLFAPLGDYQIQIRDINAVPSTFLLKTSQSILDEVQQPIVIADDPELWDALPVVSNTFQSAGKKEVAPSPQKPTEATASDKNVSKVKTPDPEKEKTATPKQQPKPQPPREIQPVPRDAPNNNALVMNLVLSGLCVLGCAATIFYVRRQRR